MHYNLIKKALYKDYYLNKKHKNILLEYKKYIEKLFILSDIESSSLHTQNIIDFETELAKNLYDIEKRRNSDITYNKILFNSFDKKSKNFDYKEFLLNIIRPKKRTIIPTDKMFVIFLLFFIVP